MKKRVLYFVPTFSNLSETFILREVEKLLSRGNIEVHVLSLKEGKAKLSDNLSTRVTYLKIKFSDFGGILIYSFKNVKSILKVLFKFAKESEDSFFQKIKLFIKGIIYSYYVSFFKFDNLHIHFLSDISTIFSIAALINNKPFSISGHARDIFVDPSSINFKVQNSKFITLCNTKAYLKCIELSGGKGRKNVIMSFHGVDSDKYIFKERKISATDKINVLTDARFTHKKGLKPLSEAIVKLVKEFDFNISFTIVGLANTSEQQAHLEEIKNIFKDNKIYEVLEIPGNGKGIQQELVSDIYRNSDVFIYAGVDSGDGDADGVPNGLLQAAYSGLPVITTKSGSISDLFNENNSYIIEQHSSSDIVDKFNTLILDKSRELKSRKLLENVRENFNLDNNIEYLENWFEKWKKLQ